MSTETMVLDVSNDWVTASEVQKQFMHAGCEVKSLSYSATCRQLRELGGDFYDCVPMAEHRLAFAIGDACGKGLPAALLISNVQSSLRTAMLFAGNDGAKVMNAVNHQVYTTSLAGRFATLFYGVFDASTRILRYVNAGHNPPMVIRRDGTIAYLETGGAPVGIFPDWAYEEGQVQLDPGDLLIAYTDGVTEATKSSGEYWGIEGLARAAAEHVSESPDEIVSSLFTAMDEFSQGRQEDDATVAVLRVR
ncbi:MAG TPA: PP2C family protein-serine/threonine phosphatase [Candidatus Acidoferrales bacterium]|nr:PP2C family protein-serine/threonine phosphatase [Candidatus Acidoferrales bacterium]